ncbi:MAG TPA: energy transducer TonB [Chitinophagaceae bacterium]|nr:energy transducer TonB [Chitinophagaceae bacterium]
MKMRPVFTFLLLSFLSIRSYAQVLANDSTKNDGTVKFERVEVEASYPGGSSAWLKFLTKTVKGDVPMDNNAPAGTYTVMVQFIVNRDSSITDFKALTNHGYGMEQEVIRALHLSGKWIPAIQKGRPVRAYRKQPVTFRVEVEGLDIETETPGALYLTKENKVSIKAFKVKDEDLLVTVSQGTIIKNGGGEYTIKLTKKDRVIIRLYNIKKDRSEGEAIFDVRE